MFKVFTYTVFSYLFQRNKMSFKLLSDYCGDPVYTFNTDNSCVSSTSTTDGSRHVGSYIEFRCLSLLTGFISQHDYCPLKVCQSDTYWGTSELSCGSKFF